MKFKDKDGNVFEDIRDALDAFCPAPNMSHEDCEKCLFQCSELTCAEFSDAFPIAAAHLMGFEVVDDETKTEEGEEMTAEKAIERLENHTQYYIPVDDLPAFEMACDALREQIPEDEKCATCANANPSIACVNCGSKHWNYVARESMGSMDKQNEDSYQMLDCVQRLELSKAMLGRGVSEKMAWQIIRDFQVRMDSLKELIK